MKKTLLTALGLGAMLLAACGSKGPATQTVSKTDFLKACDDADLKIVLNTNVAVTIAQNAMGYKTNISFNITYTLDDTPTYTTDADPSVQSTANSYAEVYMSFNLGNRDTIVFMADSIFTIHPYSVKSSNQGSESTYTWNDNGTLAAINGVMSTGGATITMSTTFVASGTSRTYESLPQ